MKITRTKYGLPVFSLEGLNLWHLMAIRDALYEKQKNDKLLDNCEQKLFSFLDSASLGSIDRWGKDEIIYSEKE